MRVWLLLVFFVLPGPAFAARRTKVKGAAVRMIELAPRTPVKIGSGPKVIDLTKPGQRFVDTRTAPPQASPKTLRSPILRRVLRR
jgi:hypothetical protein